MKRTLLALIAEALLVAVVALPCVGQEVPPRPVPDIVADFRENPRQLSEVEAIAEECPLAPGSWRHELASDLAALPRGGGAEATLAVAFSTVVRDCPSDLLTGWLRETLETGMPSRVRMGAVAAALGTTGREEDRAAALRAVLDPRFDDRTREFIVATWALDDPSPFTAAVEIIAEAFEAYDGQSPRYLNRALVRTHQDDDPERALVALRRLLGVLVRTPDKEAAPAVARSILASTTLLSGDEPLMQEIGDAMQAVAINPQTPEELRRFVTDRLGTVCRGPEEDRMARCP